jgi:hypothetical protein
VKFNRFLNQTMNFNLTTDLYLVESLMVQYNKKYMCFILFIIIGVEQSLSTLNFLTTNFKGKIAKCYGLIPELFKG